jgi:hypothetical protein
VSSFDPEEGDAKKMVAHPGSGDPLFMEGASSVTQKF